MKTEEKELRVLEYLEGDLTAEEEKSFTQDAANDPELAMLLSEYKQQERGLESYYAERSEASLGVSRPDLRLLPVAIDPPKLKAEGRNRRVIASLAIAAGLFAAGTYFLSGVGGTEHPTTVASLAGKPQLISASGAMETVTPQMTIVKSTERFKTPEGSRLELALGKTGPRVELNSNSTVELHRESARTTVKLDRGEVMVWPASNAKSAVSVTTPQLQAKAESDAAFSVVRGLRGSEVAVLRGEVEVTVAGGRRRIRQGESFSSTGVMPLPIAQRVSWSAKGREAAAELPASFSADPVLETVRPAMEIAMADNVANTTGQQDAAAKVSMVSPETTNAVFARSTDSSTAIGLSRTTDYLPSRTLSFVEIPNFSALRLTATSKESVRDILQRTNLRDFVSAQLVQTGASQEKIDEVLAKLGEVASPEDLDVIKNALGGSISAGITKNGPVFIAELSENADRINAIFAEKINPWMAKQSPKDSPALRGVVQNNFLVVGVTGEDFDETLAATASFRPTAFKDSSFLSEVHADAAQSRVTAALDAAGLRNLVLGDNPRAERLRFFENTGLVNMKSIVSATSFSDQASNRALRVKFDGERRGMMNWLGEPAPLGSLQFFSPDAQFITAARIRKPEQMLQDIFRWGMAENPGMAPPESDAGIVALKNLAATLGNEAAFGLDNPVLPVPNLKAVLEVNDPVKFHDAMLALIEEVSNDQPLERQVVLETKSYRDRLIVNMHFPTSMVDISYAVINDYVVFGPGTAFLQNTVDLALEGQSIDREAAFMDALPAKSGSYVSMLSYVATGKGLGDAAPMVQKFLDLRGVKFNVDRLENKTGSVKPTVAYAVAEKDHIDLFLNGVTGEYQMAGSLPVFANWLSTNNP